MYSALGQQTGLTDYRKVDNAKNFKNFLKVYSETNVKGQIHLEANFVRNNGIQIRNFYISKNNLDNVISKFESKGFIIKKNSNNNISYLESIRSNVFHPEFNNEGLQDFKRQGFNNSFNQKFNT